VVASGGEWQDPEAGEVEQKLHLHWRLTAPTRTDVEHGRLREARTLAAQIVGADASAKPIVHPLRWPGSWHTKGAARMARIVEANPDAEIVLDAALVKLSEAAAATTKEIADDGAPQDPAAASQRTASLTEIASWLDAIPNRELPWDEWNRVGMAAWAASEGKAFEAFDRWSAKAAKYNAEATAARWQHYATSPPDKIGAGTLAYLAAKADPQLAAMNEKFAVVQIGGKTRVVSWEDNPLVPGSRLPVYQTLEDFQSFQRKWRIEYTDAQGNAVKVARGKWWLDHPHRRQYSGVVFAPNAAPSDMLNLWTGWGCVPRAGDCGLYIEHLERNICNGDRAHAQYLLNWMASAVQHPERQGEVAVVLRGKEGTGKGVFASQFGRLFGSHFLQISNAKHLVGNFNAHLQQCSLLFADEAFFAGDRTHEGVLKALVTEGTLMIEPKGINAFSARNHIHLIMASNNAWVVPAGGDSRRYFVLDVSDARKQDTRYFGEVAHQMDTGGREALLAFLLARDLGGFNVRNVPQTAALDDQKGFTRTGIDRLIEKCASEGVLPCAYSNSANVALTSGEGQGGGFYCAARTIAPDLRHVGSMQMAKVLRKEWDCKPFVQLLKDNEAVLYAMAEHFKLGRLREPTRLRFQAAIDLARKNSAPTTPVVLAPQASVQLSLTADGSGLPN